MLEHTTRRRRFTLGAALLLLACHAAADLPHAAGDTPKPTTARHTPGAAAGTASDVGPGAASRTVVASTAGATVGLHVQPDRRAVLQDGDGVVHVRIDLQAPSGDGEVEQVPTDMLVVLDISGSMSGHKLSYAKRALHDLIDRLSPRDRFSLVTYESRARLTIPFARATTSEKRGFRRVVQGMQTAGGTNMSEGLDLALDELRRVARSGRRHTRVLLLSDGLANEGDASLAGLSRRAREIVKMEDVMSTMGVGDDFNEDLMTALADTGTGNFYYLAHVETLGHFFDAELRAASETVASAVELRLHAEPGVTLIDVGGYPITGDSGNSAGRPRSAYLVRPGNLYAGQQRTLWATLQVPASRPGQVPIGTFSLQYRSADGLQLATAPEVAPIACVSEPGDFEAGIVTAVWEDYLVEEAYEHAQADLGRAVLNGTARDVDRARDTYAENRALARRLGSQRVLRQVTELEQRAARAKRDQKASAAQRRLQGKRMKARALFNRRADAYNDDPLAGLDGL